MNFLGLNKSYYSFISVNVKFIILDFCHIKRQDGYEPYIKRNYNNKKDEYPYIPPDERTWLKNELEDEDKYYLVF